MKNFYKDISEVANVLWRKNGSSVPFHWPPVTRHPSPVTCHRSSVTRHRPSAIGHPSPVIRHPSSVIGLLAIMLTLFTSCTQKTFDTKEQLWEHLNDPENGYLHTKTINGVDFSIVYKPTDLLVDQELEDEKDKKAIDSLRDKYGKYLYFNLSMSKNNRELLSNVAGNKQQFGAMVNELAFGMDQKVHLYTPAKDTIPMADYIYPRMYGMSGTTTMLLVYPREKKETNAEVMTLTIEDLGFYTGEVKFKIPTEVFKNEPELMFGG